MSEKMKTEFEEYYLTDTETLAASIFNLQQIQHLHNLRTQAARKKLSLIFTPQDIQGYLQQEAAITTEIGVYDNLIESSAFATQELNYQAQLAADNNENQEGPLESPNQIFD